MALCRCGGLKDFLYPQFQIGGNRRPFAGSLRRIEDNERDLFLDLIIFLTLHKNCCGSRVLCADQSGFIDGGDRLVVAVVSPGHRIGVVRKRFDGNFAGFPNSQDD